MKKITILTVLIMTFHLSMAQTALDFDPNSGDQQVEILGITCPSEFTFEAWVNYRGISIDYPTILEFGDDEPFFGLDGDFLTLFDIIYSTSTIPFNQWIHVAVTFSTINSEANLYINGILDATETSVTISISGTEAGIGYNGSDDVFDGSIDDVRIWNVVRTEAEIFGNMNICLTGSESNLYAFYNFNEGSGTIVNDLSSNNFNGTLINMDSNTDWIAYNDCSDLSVEEQNLSLSITLFPNPTTDYIQLSNFTNKEDYIIYNILGSKIKDSNISHNEKIDVRNLTNGLYFLKFDNGTTLKFIKE
ncbi:MAG: LamG-like jellyroll fold domain-containing protein [Psychroserpens sp.]|uniref:LamG-like jellyroll fold domain-containing protein n=1 Tax=Psychroserpens sp. TaxID=2020870 RepID=UPI003001FBFF